MIEFVFWFNHQLKRAFVAIVHEHKLLNVSELATLHTIYRLSHGNFFETILQLSVVENKNIIEILSIYCGLPKLEDHKVKAINALIDEEYFSVDCGNSLDFYIENGYFIFIDDMGNKSIAINNVKKLDHLNRLDSKIHQIYLVDDQQFQALLSEEKVKLEAYSAP